MVLYDVPAPLYLYAINMLRWGRPAPGALLGLRVSSESCDESVFYNKARVRKKTDPLKGAPLSGFPKKLHSQTTPGGPLSPPDLSCSVWFHLSVLFCRVVCSLPLVVSTLPNP